MRNLEFHLYRWASASRRIILMLHGWGDSGATFQFVVDELPREWHAVAPDLRGFGRSQWATEGYWFPDYFADLDALVDALAEEPIDLVGHSMGGNIALMFAALRPEKVRRVVSLEGFGLPPTHPTDALLNYRRWLDQLRQPVQFSSYSSYAELVQTLAQRHPRTSLERLQFIAHAWAREEVGQIVIRADPRHKWTNPVLYRHEEVAACWANIRAPTLFVTAENSDLAVRLRSQSPQANVIVPQVTTRTVTDAGHMMHHEQPETVARLIVEFLKSS